MKKIWVLACLLIFLSDLAWSKDQSVGVKVRHFNNEGQSLAIMVWYPAKVTGQHTPFGYYGLNKGKAIREAEIKPGQYPLVVFSHGLGMCAYQSVFLTENLAAKGYVVVAPDHDDAAMCHIGGGSDLTKLELIRALFLSQGELANAVATLFPDKLAYLKDPDYRPQQISLVIDRLLADPFFGSLINSNQIGVMGHSFGGWAALAVSGGEIDCTDPHSYSDWICKAPDQKFSAVNMQMKICCGQKYQGKRTAFHDSRVKATLALGPGSFIYPNYEALDIDNPVMLISGNHFEVNLQVNVINVYDLLAAPRFRLKVFNVDHMTVSDLMFYSLKTAPLSRGYWLYDWKKQFYQEYSQGFFNAYLRSDFFKLDQLLIQSCPLRELVYEK
jgi:predicted dienelactone hydrolase